MCCSEHLEEIQFIILGSVAEKAELFYMTQGGEDRNRARGKLREGGQWGEKRKDQLWVKRQNLGTEMLHGCMLDWRFKSRIFNKAHMVYWHFCKNGLFARIQRDIEFHIWVNKLNRLQRPIMPSGSHLTFPSVGNSPKSPWSSDESMKTTYIALVFHS